MGPPIPIESLPPSETYGSFGDAVAGAKSHPLQPKAEEDAAKLVGARVEDALWTDAEQVIAFSNGFYLHVEVKKAPTWIGDVAWRVSGQKPELNGDVEGLGSPPLLLDWGPKVGVSPMDRSALAEKRLGAVLSGLFVSDGFYVYCRKQLIWCFMAAKRADRDTPLLHVSEEE